MYELNALGEKTELTFSSLVRQSYSCCIQRLGTLDQMGFLFLREVDPSVHLEPFWPSESLCLTSRLVGQNFFFELMNHQKEQWNSRGSVGRHDWQTESHP
jgi:hypothetical protein